MRLIQWLCMALALTGGSVTAAAQTADEQRQIAWTLERGRLLFALDRAAWVATDDMLARVPDPQNAGILGYVVDRDAEGFSTIFFGREQNQLVAIYRARIAANGVADPQVFPAGERPALTPVQRRLAEALLWVREQLDSFERCSPHALNAAIIPPETPDGPLDIYVMTPQMRTGRWPFGGHHRITVGPDGREIARRAFTRSCLEMPAPPPEMRAQGAMLGVSHLLDPLPTEIHVFTALAAQQPIAVMVEQPQRLWRVTGEEMRVLQEGPLQER